MRLVKDTNPGAFAVSVLCIGERHEEIKERLVAERKLGAWATIAPSRMFTLAEGYADLDGPPFVAYYCGDCARADYPEEVAKAERRES